ncbi:hypothetical protein [Gaoshiqia sediminis]|uniref:Uncharacterized protein n=1 Tax=Gaoshiqia sediminis TaxID=2986998 RepID=A0AA41Y4V8_9BACT|nr:hypothetical protein [Gaoshiqia sediminis]MCW0481890.1 hypothetical protein [Gaoshiqia sediminis]
MFRTLMIANSHQQGKTTSPCASLGYYSFAGVEKIAFREASMLEAAKSPSGDLGVKSKASTE